MGRICLDSSHPSIAFSPAHFLLSSGHRNKPSGVQPGGRVCRHLHSSPARPAIIVARSLRPPNTSDDVGPLGRSCALEQLRQKSVDGRLPEESLREIRPRSSTVDWAGTGTSEAVCESLRAMTAATVVSRDQGKAERLQSYCGTNGAHARSKTRRLQDRPDSEQALSHHIVKQCRGRPRGSRNFMVPVVRTLLRSAPGGL